MLKRITIMLLLVSAILAVINGAEKYAVIYSPVKKNISIEKSSNNLDPKDMEVVWKETFLKWEKLVRDGYKFENIYVLYGEGIDYYRLAIDISYRYTPAHFCLPINYKITKGEANKNTLDKTIEGIESKVKAEDTLNIWKYINEKFIESD